MVSACRFDVIAVVAALIATALGMAGTAAQAATVSVAPGSAMNGGKVLYRAAAGEQNVVTIEREYAAEPMVGVFDLHYVVTITDPGAVIEAGSSCTAVDTHTARCPTNLDVPVQVQLADLDDQLRSVPTRAPSRGVGVTIMGHGGSGDDLLDVRQGVALGVLDGGGGRDQLFGGQFPDFLTDGDRDDVRGEAAPGPDVLDGGDGGSSPGDVIGYQQRTRPVSVDLASDRPGGARGEGDVVRGIESVVGGSGPDRLAGTKGPNYIVGGAGQDALVGRGGTDRFGSVALFLPIDPGFLGPLPEGTRGDTVTCGRGRDDVTFPTASTYVKPDCELLRLSTRDRYTNGTQIPYPTRRGTYLAYPVHCSDEADFEDPKWAAVRCSGALTLREAARPRRLLASGVIARGRFVIPTRLQLTRTGRRLATRERGVRAVMHVSGRHLPTASWTIRLKLPR